MSSLTPALRQQLGQYADYCNEHIEGIERLAAKDDLTSKRVAAAFRQITQQFIENPSEPFEFSPSVLTGLRQDSEIVENLNELVRILKGESDLFPFPVNLDGEGRVVGGYSQEELRALQQELCSGVAIKVNTTISNLMRKRKETQQEHAEIKRRREEARAENLARIEQARRRNTFEGALELVKGDGLALERLSPIFQNNKDIVLAAVTQNGRALQFAHPRLQNDNDVVRLALQHEDSDFIFQHVGEAFKANREQLLQAIRGNEMAIGYGQDELVEDRAFIIDALRENPMVLQLLSEPLRNDYELVVIALEGVDEDQKEWFIANIVGNEIRPRILAERQRSLDFIEAVKNGDTGRIQALLAHGAISEQDRGWAVVWAASQGHLEIVRALSEHGAISEQYRGQAVGLAVEGGHLEIVRALLAHGAISEQDRGWAVVWAVEGGHLEIVRALLAHGAISERARGRAVRLAASYGHPAIVQLFTQLKMD